MPITAKDIPDIVGQMFDDVAEQEIENMRGAYIRRDCQDLLSWFRSDHLPQGSKQKSVAVQFAAFADELLQGLPPSAEIKLALTHLLQAKDAAVRARIRQEAKILAAAKLAHLKNEGGQ